MNIINFIIVVSMVLLSVDLIANYVYGQSINDLIQRHNQEEKYRTELMNTYRKCLMLKLGFTQEQSESFTGNVTDWPTYNLEKVVTDCYDEGWIK